MNISSPNIISMGIDSIDIIRFKDWSKYNINILKKIFTQEEINYCLNIKTKSAERFAARFCAKEACYKALNILTKTQINLFAFFKYIEIKKSSCGAPQISINFTKIQLKDNIFINKILLSITHTKSTATALVIVT